MKTFNIGEARDNLSQIVDMVLAGEKVVIGKRNHPLVKLIPLIEEQPIKKRVGGQLRGQIHIADDFDDLSEDILEAFEGKHP
ncbi:MULTISPECIES: type II toxin-antitoxin system Phd/YefM family antitoxin [Aquimarina]|uniref:Antitoxin n=1 Tax=Aquimarina algiphila TaxID=2047982 RepID=A0A554VCD8_9FLAO|nr:MULTISPECIES: type II toxin-antitoxin system prevent-host-death family antitoxin [Aquimarina]TSE04363.1 type II toxin-antitoxin system prevent-host-death family antitoxin [Aquimarina algiphila]